MVEKKPVPFQAHAGKKGLGPKIIWVCVSIAIILFAKGLFKKKPQKNIPPRPVEIAEAVVRDVPVYIDSFGNLTPPNDVDIKSQVTGAVKEVNFTEGAEVRTGDLLFTIDPAQFEAQLKKAQAALLADTASLSLKKNTLERNRALFDKKLISQQEFDKYQTDFAAAEAAVKLDAAEVELAKISLEYCYIRSPVDGLAGKRQVDLGNIVSAYSGPTLVNVKTMDTLYVDFTVAENYLDGIRKAMAAGKLKVEAIVGDDESRKYPGELELLDNSVDNTTGTILLRALVANKDKALWSGQFVRVRLILSVKKDAVLVPYDAVQLGQKGSYLFVVTEDNKADLRLVKSGSRQQENIVIEDGVKPGEKVVTAGQLGLSPGASVMDAVEMRKMQQEAAAKQKKK